MNMKICMRALPAHTTWAAAVVLVAGCTTSTSTPPMASAAPAAMPWVADARAVAAALPPKLMSVLRPAIEKDGAASAIQTCNVDAPRLGKEASDASGWMVRRVSLRNRNPKAVPDAWERETLHDFDRRAAAGDKADTLERAGEVMVDGRRTLRYMKALPVGEMCLACHGAPDRLAPGVNDKLKALYPDDRGTGYKLGEIRGAITLKKPAS